MTERLRESDVDFTREADLRALFVPEMSRMIARTILEQAVLNSIEQGYTAEQIIDEVVKTLGKDEVDV